LWWNKFYKNNTSNFFKDRKWLFHEFPILKELTAENASDSLILEVGAGVGNTAFPVMRQNQNPRLRLHACDFSKKAVEIMKANTEVDGSSTVGKFEASVWDITASPHPDGAPHLPEGIRANSVDVVILIFVFSALEPSQWEQAVSNIWAMLKPGGTVLFRDYGRGDLAQVRFKAGRYLEENFYIRGDGTRVYFFDEDQLKELWSAPCKVKSTESSDRENGVPGLADKEDADPLGQPQNVGSKFDIVHFGVDRRMLVNRQRRLKMYRCWMQAVFKKQGEQSHQMSDKVDE
jgi:tRNAThr (cytosine32-N3)-methyltransferase